MDFKQFITNSRYRKRLSEKLSRYGQIQPRKNPTPRYITALVSNLLDARKSRDAARELELIGAPAAPLLAAALDDPRYRDSNRPEDSRINAPFDTVLGLLVPTDPVLVVAIASSLVGSESKDDRKIAAIHCAETGLALAEPALTKLLSDPEADVRSYVLIGLDRALEVGRLSDGLRIAMYPVLLAVCMQEWKFASNRSPEMLLKLDPERAACDLVGRDLISPDNPNLREVLSACKKASVLVPEEHLHAVFEDALTRLTQDKPYPHDSVAGCALELLAGCLTEDELRPLIERALASKNDRLQESAAYAVARQSGLADPVDAVFRRIQEVGYDGLTVPQRVVYCASLFDGEVCNGGITQFFGNSSGDYAVDTLDALEQLGHPEAISALTKAIHALGPLAREPDRDMRLEAFTDRFDELQEVFGPLESAYYKTNSGLRSMIVLFAANHADDFR